MNSLELLITALNNNVGKTLSVKEWSDLIKSDVPKNYYKYSGWVPSGYVSICATARASLSVLSHLGLVKRHEKYHGKVARSKYESIGEIKYVP